MQTDIRYGVEVKMINHEKYRFLVRVPRTENGTEDFNNAKGQVGVAVQEGTCIDARETSFDYLAQKQHTSLHSTSINLRYVLSFDVVEFNEDNDIVDYQVTVQAAGKAGI